MRYSIDRFEENVAVLVDEQGGTRDVPRSDLPSEAKDGDMVCWEAGVFRLDEDATVARRRHILALQNRLRRKK